MNVNHVLNIHDGNVVKTFQEFISAWWQQTELDAVLAPVELPDHAGVMPTVIEHPDQISTINPFAPVMLNNSADMVEGFVRQHPNHHLAVIMRPCELRALMELKKRGRVHYQPIRAGNGHTGLVIMGVDCPGTFPLNEYTKHVTAHQADAEMIRVALVYGKQDSYIPYQAREACQLCDSPNPMNADVIIGTIGIAPENHLLVIAHDADVDTALKLSNITNGPAVEQQVVGREVMVGKLVDKRIQKRLGLLYDSTGPTEEMNSLIAMFARCTLCADCLDACPLYDGELTSLLGVIETRQKVHPLLTELVSVSRWLASCCGCGMCQQACEHNVALTRVVTALSHRIQNELHYKPGDPDQPLPWTT